MNRVRKVRDVLLRPSAESELPRLSDLTETIYGVRREPDVLRWLLFHQGSGPEVESLVAERNGRVVGHVASLRCRYQVHGRTVVGAHRMLWMVEADSRGAAGVPLAGRSPETDFEVVLGGTAATRAILVMRGFREIGEALEVRLPAAAAREAAAARGGISMALRDYDPAARAASVAGDMLVNVADPDHLAWLASCPEHDSLLFTLERAGKSLGPVLLYVNRGGDGPTGRIVHMPYIEEGVDSALAAILDRLGREGCVEASILATDGLLLGSAQSLGGEICYRRPLWFRTPNGEVQPARFYLTYMEGDLAYRRV